MFKKINGTFYIQWHITAKCDQNCLHCYVSDPATYKNELKNGLDYKSCLLILDDLYEFIVKYLNLKLEISFSGGDPLLSPYFFKLLKKTKELGIKVTILGNSHHLTSEIAEKLRSLGVKEYQLSLDGMEKIHDYIRGAGSFVNTINGIEILKKAGIFTKIMFTISKKNMVDLINVAKLCSAKGVDLFAFDSVVPIGNTKTSGLQILSDQELREKMYEYDSLITKQKNAKIKFGRKGNLWNLFDLELGRQTTLLNARKSNKIITGCSIGISTITILSDGSVLPCRRLPIIIGKFPKQSFQEVFFGKAMANLRQENKIEKCNNCELFSICRGCRALAYAVCNNYFAPDPHCWKS